MRARLRNVDQRLWLSAKGNQIVEIEPGLDVFARGGEIADGVGEELQRLYIAIRTSALHEVTPLLNFPGGALVLRVRIDPFQNLAIAFASRQFFPKSSDVDDDVLIGGPAFVEQSRQDGVTAETAARAAGRALGEIGRGDFGRIGHK